MTAKFAVITIASGLCFVPAAIVAGTNETRSVPLQATTGIASRVERVAKQGRVRPAAVELEPVVVVAGLRHVRPSDRKPTAQCSDWRPLVVGPAARAASSSLVRVCDGVSEASPPVTAPRAQPPATRASATPPLEFVVDLARPER